MKIKTKYNIGQQVCFLSIYGEIEKGIISKINIDVAEDDSLSYYTIRCYNKNLCFVCKNEEEIYLSIEELKENIEQITHTIYKYKNK